MLPHMTPEETMTFNKYLLHSTNYFEYGSGGSTYMAAGLPNIKHMCTVEADETWIDEMKMTSDEVKHRMENNTIQFYVIDINCDSTFWSYPKDVSKKDEWSKYPSALTNYIRTHGMYPDFILVDGRFRVACVVKVLMELHDSQPIIAIHDYADRECYHVVEEFMDVLEQVDSLVVFRARKDIDLGYLKYMYDHFVHDVR